MHPLLSSLISVWDLYESLSCRGFFPSLFEGSSFLFQKSISSSDPLLRLSSRLPYSLFRAPLHNPPPDRQGWSESIQKDKKKLQHCQATECCREPQEDKTVMVNTPGTRGGSTSKRLWLSWRLNDGDSGGSTSQKLGLFSIFLANLAAQWLITFVQNDSDQNSSTHRYEETSGSD